MKDKKTTKATVESKYLYFKTKRQMITVSAITAAALLIVALLMFIESGYGNLIIKNKSDLKLEYVKTSFIDVEANTYNGVETEAIDAHKTFKKSTESINLLGYNANYEIRFKFEGHDEMLVDTGIFNDVFKGNMNVVFSKTDDANVIKMHVKASNGLFSSKLIDCNETYTIDLKEGKVLQ